MCDARWGERAGKSARRARECGRAVIGGPKISVQFDPINDERLVIKRHRGT